MQIKVRDNRLRSTPPLRKLGCDVGLAAHRATGALGRLLWGLGKDLRAAAVAKFGGSHGRNGTYCRPSLTSLDLAGKTFRRMRLQPCGQIVLFSLKTAANQLLLCVPKIQTATFLPAHRQRSVSEHQATHPITEKVRSRR